MSEREPQARVLRVPSAAVADAARACADAVAAGELVVIPTDTVYGIAADTLNESALVKIFEAKGRPQDMPIPVLVASVDDVSGVAAGELSAEARALMERFWPGALTVIVPRAGHLPPVIAAGGDTIGLRLPDCEVARAIIAECGGALATTSANFTTLPPACAVDELAPELLTHIAVVIDSGRCPGGTASTVLDLTTCPPQVLREGPITREQLRELLPDLQ